MNKLDKTVDILTNLLNDHAIFNRTIKVRQEEKKLGKYSSMEFGLLVKGRLKDKKAERTLQGKYPKA